MNVGGFGQGVKLVGLNHLQHYADDIENPLMRADQELSQKNAESKGQAVGTLVGTGVGLLKGGYQSYQQGEFNKDVRNVEKARSLFPDEASYQASIKKNYSPEVRREVGLRRLLPAEVREAAGDNDPWRDFVAGSKHFDSFLDYK